ncbi:MAG: class I SAM-dependent methyltransferase [Proteobacteria bacterium]|nr:class I SAM-dependent methyltransferase [Pseudomonadota bacterium]
MRIRLAAAHHAQGFRWAREAGLPVPAEGSRALEIGFNEGYSPLALATLGFDVTAIDNSYGLDDRAPGEIGFFSSVVGASVSALYADLTRGLPFPDGHFDYVFSSSVLEHILDIKGALAELRRVLRPGGLAVHSFGSYHCCDGAHAIAIPDQPWGHSRMTADQYVSYIKTWRPYESDRAAAWLESAIARRPIAATAAALAQTGFDIHRWIETPSPKSHLAHLAPDVVREALNANPDISIADLTTRDVYFIAT